MTDVTLKLTSSLDDVPAEVSHFLEFVERELLTTSERIGNIIINIENEHEDKETILKLMQSLRHNLIKIDIRLEDCMSIWGGYMDVLDNPLPAKEEEEIEENKNAEG